MTFEKLFDLVVKKHTDDDFIVYFKDAVRQSMTGADYDRKTDAIAALLEKRLSSVKPGVWTALKAGNNPLWFAALFALLKIGYKVVMLDANSTAEQVEAFRQQSDFKAVITDRTESFENVETITFNEFENIFEGTPERVCWSDKIGFCTSGTTGNARIYVFTADAICWQCENISYYALHNEEVIASQRVKGMQDNPILLTLPFRHCMGFGISIYFWASGCPLVLPVKEGVFGIIDTCRENNIWFLSAVPAVWKAILQICRARFGDSRSESIHKLLGESMTFAVSGGAKIDKVLAENLINTGILFYNGWGMTEAGNVVIGNIADDESLDYSGMPYNHEYPERKMHDIKIVSPEDGSLVDEGLGELVLSGRSMHSATLENGEEILRDPDSYFRTGDLFEKKGPKVYFKGRCKSVIINDTGENIYPEELDAHFSFISDYQIQYCTAEYESRPALYIYTKEKGDFIQTECYNRIVDANYKLPLGKRAAKVIQLNKPIPITSKGESARFFVCGLVNENVNILPIVKKG